MNFFTLHHIKNYIWDHIVKKCEQRITCYTAVVLFIEWPAENGGSHKSCRQLAVKMGWIVYVLFLAAMGYYLFIEELAANN